MLLQLPESELRSLIEQIVELTVIKLDALREQTRDRLGFTEAEAAALIGVPKHVLRDARLRGEISGRPVGKRIVYSRDELLRFLDTNEERGCGAKRNR